MANFNELKTQAAVIRDETSEGKNTALRVGQMFVDTLTTMEGMVDAELSGTSTNAIQNKAVNAAIIHEAAERTNADDELSTAINDEAKTRASAVLKLVNDLTAETSARRNADDELSAGITAEAAERNNADDELSAAIKAEAATRVQEDAKLSDKISKLNAYLIPLFYGIYNFAELAANPRTQDAEAAIGRVMYYSDLERFDIVDEWIDGGATFMDKSKWDYNLYNQGSKALVGHYKCSEGLYRLNIETAYKRVITKLVEFSEVKIIADAVAALLGTIDSSAATTARAKFENWYENL